MNQFLRHLLGWVYLVGVMGVPIGAGWLWMHPQSRLSRWIHRNMVDPITTHYIAWVDRRTRRRLGNACRNLPPTIPRMPWHEWRYIANPVRRWCALAPRAAVVHAFKVVLLAVALLNVGTLVNVAWHFWHNPQVRRDRAI